MAVSSTCDGEWEVINGQVDSAAAVTICGKDVAAEQPVSKTEIYKKGVYYMSASNDPIDNIGDKK